MLVMPNNSWRRVSRRPNIASPLKPSHIGKNTGLKCRHIRKSQKMEGIKILPNIGVLNIEIDISSPSLLIAKHQINPMMNVFSDIVRFQCLTVDQDKFPSITLAPWWKMYIVDSFPTLSHSKIKTLQNEIKLVFKKNTEFNKNSGRKKNSGMSSLTSVVESVLVNLQVVCSEWNVLSGKILMSGFCRRDTNAFRLSVVMFGFGKTALFRAKETSLLTSSATSFGLLAETERNLRPPAAAPPRLYGLPKIHKDGIPLRPIVSAINSPTYNLAKYLTGLLSPHVGKCEHHIRNSSHLINILDEIHLDPSNIMVILDVVSLFTKVPLKETFQQLEAIFDKRTIDLFNIALTTTYFLYEGVELLQQEIQCTLDKYVVFFHRSAAAQLKRRQLKTSGANKNSLDKINMREVQDSSELLKKRNNKTDI
ncbi:hypothetical protein J437_LFUL012835 [Ladona fulva]|uniref:Reverse transcriptase domain-containing protein n=1 Tax=Ladona fulva TaxID=123851 RepID=A0A8K0KLD0_LADFU|nr:hypothetical protein J437_LFUL012835 [Ladona fulva]